MSGLTSNVYEEYSLIHILRFIIQTDSSIIVKDDDGTEIQLKILKNPIDIEELVCENEDDKEEQNTDTVLKGTVVDKRKRTKKVKPTETMKYTKEDGPMSFLKEPLSIDGMAIGQKIDIRMQSMNKAPDRKSPKGKTLDLDHERRKENALTLFEFSYVYPFIHASNKYKCFVCAEMFLDTSLLREHSITGHTAKDYKTELNNRVRDKTLKVDVTLLQCRICRSVFPNLQALKIHLKDHHDKKIDLECRDNMIPFKLGDDDFQCQVCEERFLKLRLLIIHMNKHFNNYSCETCGAVFMSLHLLRRHLQTHKSGSFPCEVCDKVFSNSAKRTMHMRGVHLKQHPRTCPICPERFNSNYQRTKHLRIVHNQSSGLFKCETCGREYDLKYQLLIHIRSVHMQERNQECGICHSRFFSKYCLSRHMMIHTGEKNFKCEVCGKAYARKKNLKEHMKSHENPRVCSVCCQDCGDHASLVVHMSHSHGIV